MRKTVDLTKGEIEIVENFQKRNGLKNFSKALKTMINIEPEIENCTCNDEHFALLADAIVKIDKKLNLLVGTLAPKNAGEL